MPYWNWDYLSGNRAIDWTIELMAKYKSRFNYERYQVGNDEYWLNIKYSRSLDQSPVNQSISEQVVINKKDLYEKKLNESGPTKQKSLRIENNASNLFDILEEHKDNLNWEAASLNKSLPWTEELIDKYKDKWEWGHEEERPDGKAFIQGLTSNPKLPWSVDLIRRFQNFWYWPDLSYSKSIPWSLELLEEFHDKWDWSILEINQTLWERVFYPYIDPATIRKLLNS
jgi:hypothetical protein